MLGPVATALVAAVVGLLVNFSHDRVSESDLRAIHAFIRHLGPAGSAAPADVPPPTH